MPFFQQLPYFFYQPIGDFKFTEKSFFGQLYQKFGPMVLRRCRFILKDEEKALDAMYTCRDTESITLENGGEYIDFKQAVEELEQIKPVDIEIK